MSIISDFKEFRDLKKHKLLYTHKLYVAELGHFYVSSSYYKPGIVKVSTEFKRRKYVIVEEISAQEFKKLKKLNAIDNGPLGIFYESKRFKILTMGGKIIPLINSGVAMDIGEGIVEVVKTAYPIDAIIHDLPDTIDMDYVKQLEEGINQHMKEKQELLKQ